MELGNHVPLHHRRTFTSRPLSAAAFVRYSFSALLFTKDYYMKFPSKCQEMYSVFLCFSPFFESNFHKTPFALSGEKDSVVIQFFSCSLMEFLQQVFHCKAVSLLTLYIKYNMPGIHHQGAVP